MGPAADGAGRREDMERRDAAHEVGMWGNFFTSTDRGIDVTENRRQYNFFRELCGTNSANIPLQSELPNFRVLVDAARIGL